MEQSPCFLSPLADYSLLPFLVPSTYLETLLAVTGSVHLGLRLLVNWPPLPQPFPNPYPLQIPRTQITIIKRLTITTSRTRLLLSGTNRNRESYADVKKVNISLRQRSPPKKLKLFRLLSVSKIYLYFRNQHKYLIFTSNSKKKNLPLRKADFYTFWHNWF